MAQPTRREFLARSTAAAAATALCRFGGHPLHAAEPLVKGMVDTEKLGWRVGFSAYTFRGLTLFETLDKIAQTGLHFVELWSGQKLSPEEPDARPGPRLSKRLRSELKKKAADCGVGLVGFYTGLGSPDAAKACFEFAADMGFEVIVSEPPEAVLDTIEELTEQYKIDLALHNHPQPSHYWNPEIGLAALKGRSKRLGFCCDTGHWCRSGLEPVDMLGKIATRAKTFHLKDLDAFGVRSAKDVVWGQGKGRIADILTEVRKQGVERPYFGIEWERSTNEPIETHAKSAAFFEGVTGRLAASIES